LRVMPQDHDKWYSVGLEFRRRVFQDLIIAGRLF
jgi:hypothetical protein